MSAQTVHIRFHCTQCGKHFSVHRNLAGRDARCPCGAVLKIPVAEPDLIDLTLSEAEPIPRVKITKRRPGKVANTVAGVGIVLIVALMAYVVYDSSHGSQFDLVMFLALIAGVVASLVVLVLVILLPGMIAESRNHSKAEAIKVCGYASLILWPLWPVALVWAFTEKNPASVNPHSVNAMFAPKRDT